MRLRAHANVLGYSAGDEFDVDDHDDDALAQVRPYIIGGHLAVLADQPADDVQALPNLAALAASTPADDRAAAVRAALAEVRAADLRTIAKDAELPTTGKADDLRHAIADHYAAAAALLDDDQPADDPAEPPSE